MIRVANVLFAIGTALLAMALLRFGGIEREIAASVGVAIGFIGTLTALKHGDDHRKARKG